MDDAPKGAILMFHRIPLKSSLLSLFIVACGCAFAAPAFAAEAPVPEYIPPAYPLTTCVVSGQPLGSMGEPVVIDYEGREVRFCCAGCEPRFRSEADKYLVQLDAAIIARQKPHYPLDHCLVMPEDALHEQAVDHVHQGRLLRFCCDMCKDDFNADPQTYFDTLNRAVVAAQKPTYPLTTCVVSGDELDPHHAIDVVVGHRLVRLCCPGCGDDLKADPAAYIEKLDQAASASHDGHVAPDDEQAADRHRDRGGHRGREHHHGGHDHSH
jgi:YHS domain-containing protein